jgi:hypothetical protein
MLDMTWTVPHDSGFFSSAYVRCLICTYRIPIAIICTLLLYPGIHCNGGGGCGRPFKTHCQWKKKARRSARDQKFAIASCLTEGKLDEASNPLIIPGDEFAHRFQRSRRSWSSPSNEYFFPRHVTSFVTRDCHDLRAPNSEFINPLTLTPTDNVRLKWSPSGHSPSHNLIPQ